MSDRALTTLEALVRTTERVADVVTGLIALPFDPDPLFERQPALWADVLARVDALSGRALEAADAGAALEMHSMLYALFRLRTAAHRNRRELSAALASLRVRLCTRWIDHEVARLPRTTVPPTQEAIARWFDETVARHPAPDHPLFRYLEAEGAAGAFRHFVAQEMAVSADFADLIALTQVGAPGAWKGEMARNYWDEMGEGKLAARHSQMFRLAAAALDIKPAETKPSLGALVCGNLFLALSSYRCFQLTSIGALAVTELAVPTRFRRLVRGAQRLGLPDAVVAYYQTHVEADESHAGGWLREVIRPALEQSPEVGGEIAAGVYLRLVTSERYCDELLAAMRESERVDA